MKYNPILSLLLFSSLALLLYYTKNQFSPYFKIALQSFSVTQLKTIAKSTSPNFVFILADDLSWNSIGYENFDLNFTSPTLSSLADHGIRLSNYYAQEVCTPSRASLLTGRYPLSIGMQYGEVEDSDLWGLNLSETTIAEVLQSSGYSTYMIGKWNLGHYAEDYLPTARGFDYYVGYLTGMTYLWSKRSPLATDFLDLVYSNQDCYYPYNGTDLNDYSTYFYRNKAVDIITNHDYDSPMFLYMSMQAVHDPFSDIGMFEDGIPSSYLGDDVYHLIMNNIVGVKRQQYAMSLYLLDQAVSHVYKALDDVDQLDNTYIIFASDNGGCYDAGGRNGPLRGNKGTLFEGGTKVDSFIYHKKFDDDVKGSEYSGIMHVSDWFPTILNFAGISYTAPDGYSIDGMSQVDGLINGANSPRANLLYNAYVDVAGENYDIWTNLTFAVRDSRYKLIHAYENNPYSNWNNYDAIVEDDDTWSTGTCSQGNAIGSGTYTYFLFDLQTDELEQTNLYNSPDTETINITAIKASLYDYFYSLNTKTDYYNDVKDGGENFYTVWNQNMNYITPWITGGSSSPDLCAFDNSVVSPTSFFTDDDLLDDIISIDDDSDDK